MPSFTPRRRFLAAAACLSAAAAGGIFAQTPPAPAPTRDIRPVAATTPVANDPDDPAVWVSRADPARSLIIGTNKVAAAEGGGLYVWGLDGKERQVIRGLNRPNNVDVEYGFRLRNGTDIDIAAVTERNARALRLFRVRPDGSGLAPLASIPVFTGEQGDHAAPMGVALYKRPRDGAVFAIVGRKSGPRDGYLWQYRLRDDGRSGVRAVKVRAFGAYSGKKEIEAVCVDDVLGHVYYADERHGIHKWLADPDAPGAGRELALFGTTGFAGDHEGIALWTRPDGTGYILCTDQVPGSSAYRLYRREGEPGRPHDHTRLMGVVRGGADETDGIEAVSAPLGPRFPRGLLVTMNSGPKNFLVFDGRDILRAAAGRRR
jgi:3-phytase